MFSFIPFQFLSSFIYPLLSCYIHSFISSFKGENMINNEFKDPPLLDIIAIYLHLVLYRLLEQTPKPQELETKSWKKHMHHQDPISLLQLKAKFCSILLFIVSKLKVNFQFDHVWFSICIAIHRINPYSHLFRG